MPKATSAAVLRFEELLPVAPGVTRRLVFGHPAAFIHGNMFFGVFGPDLFVRLSDADRREIMQTEGAAPFEPMKGRPMAGYVLLPDPVLERPEKAGEWVRRSRTWVSTMPTKIPAAKAKKPPASAARTRSAGKARTP
ncbi:MAG: TfoX/Sxy family protein [Thermoplasmata archaeon]|nr:TfoX/Sxy family protein [Thermoplasmata archaeon]